MNRRRRIASACRRKLTGTAWQCSKINSNSMESSITMFYICFLIRQVKVTMKSSSNSWAAATALFLALLQCLFCSTPNLLSYEERYSVYKLSDWEKQRNKDVFDALLEERENLAWLNTEEGRRRLALEEDLRRLDQLNTPTIRRIIELERAVMDVQGGYYRTLDSGDFRRYSSVTGGSSDLATVSTTISIRDESIAGGVSTSGELTTTNPWAAIEASSGIPFEPVLRLRGGGDGNDAASLMQGKSTGAIQWNFTYTH